MSEEEQAGSPGDAPAKKFFDLDDLVVQRSPTQTSLGELYVRDPRVGEMIDWGRVDDPEALGRLAAKTLSSRDRDQAGAEGLDDSTFAQLTPADVDAVLAAIAVHNEWDEVPAGAGFVALGTAIKASLEKERKRLVQLNESTRLKLAKDYAFLPGASLTKLTEQVTGLAMFGREGGAVRAALDAMRDGQSLIDRVGGTGTFKALAESRNLVGSALELQRLREATRFGGVGHGTTGADLLYARPSEVERTQIEFPEPPRPEDSVLGQAMLQSAESTRASLAQIGELVSLVGGLNQTLVQEVLPAWATHLEDGQKDAKVAFEQAAAQLRWAKYAVWASIIVTAGFTIWATNWQVDVSRKIDAGNSQQMDRLEVLLTQQLAAQQQLIEQQAKESAALRAEVAALKPSEKRGAAHTGSKQ